MAIGTGSLSHGDALALFLSPGRPRTPPSGRRPVRLDAMSLIDSGEGRLPRLGSTPPGVGGGHPERDPERDDDRGDRDGRDGRDGRHRAGQERLEATDARIHVATDREPGGVGYGIFTNETTSAATLVALDCPAFDRVELRETIAVGDVTETRRTSSLSVLPGDSVELAPEGRLLSMTGPRRPLEEGELVGVTLTFASGRRRVVPFRVVTGTSQRDRGGR